MHWPLKDKANLVMRIGEICITRQARVWMLVKSLVNNSSVLSKNDPPKNVYINRSNMMIDFRQPPNIHLAMLNLRAFHEHKLCIGCRVTTDYDFLMLLRILCMYTLKSHPLPHTFPDTTHTWCCWLLWPLWIILRLPLSIFELVLILNKILYFLWASISQVFFLNVKKIWTYYQWQQSFIKISRFLTCDCL